MKNSAPVVAWVALTKPVICLMVAMSAATGFFCSGGKFGWDFIFTIIGVFLLAAGAATLNQIQDADIDKKMARTSRRPIPSGRVSKRTALGIAITLLTVGCTLLFQVSEQSILILGLGLGAVVWYNGFYYILKRITSFAAVPGALIGVIPPAMGWSGGGGDIAHPLCQVLCAFFFLWQLPHFWLLAMYRANDYQKSGLPSILDHFSPTQLRRITAIWMLAVSAGGMMFPLLVQFNGADYLRWIMMGLSTALGGVALSLWGRTNATHTRIVHTFRALTAYVALMMAALAVGSV